MRLGGLQLEQSFFHFIVAAAPSLSFLFLSSLFLSLSSLSLPLKTPKETLLSASFSVSLAQEFPPDVQLLAQLRLLEYVARLPDEKPESEGNPFISNDLI